MNVQLLLLLALVGPFCAFTHASPTELPADHGVGITAIATDGPPDAAEAPKDNLTVVPGPSATEQAGAHEEATTEVVTEAASPSMMVNTEEPVGETDAPPAAHTAAPETLTTDPPAVVATVPTESAEPEVTPEATGAAEADTGEEVLVEDETEEAMSSGQVVGIVIGALLAVVIVIAVVIAVVRRMGKYSFAKNKKPAKKDSVMPLRRKHAKQQERPKFWRF